MNEEERKAIEDMNKFANGIDMSCVTAKQMQIILNLIKKLQKENKLLLRRYSEPILKQAIKDKIVKLNLSILECKSLVDDDGKHKKHAKKTISFLKKQRDILKELIEEREEK